MFGSWFTPSKQNQPQTTVPSNMESYSDVWKLLTTVDKDNFYAGKDPNEYQHALSELGLRSMVDLDDIDYADVLSLVSKYLKKVHQNRIFKAWTVAKKMSTDDPASPSRFLANHAEPVDVESLVSGAGCLTPPHAPPARSIPLLDPVTGLAAQFERVGSRLEQPMQSIAPVGPVAPVGLSSVPTLSQPSLPVVDPRDKEITELRNMVSQLLESQSAAQRSGRTKKGKQPSAHAVDENDRSGGADDDNGDDDDDNASQVSQLDDDPVANYDKRLLEVRRTYEAETASGSLVPLEYLADSLHGPKGLPMLSATGVILSVSVKHFHSKTKALERTVRTIAVPEGTTVSSRSYNAAGVFRSPLEVDKFFEQMLLAKSKDNQPNCGVEIEQMLVFRSYVMERFRRHTGPAGPCLGGLNAMWSDGMILYSAVYTVWMWACLKGSFMEVMTKVQSTFWQADRLLSATRPLPIAEWMLVARLCLIRCPVCCTLGMSDGLCFTCKQGIHVKGSGLGEPKDKLFTAWCATDAAKSVQKGGLIAAYEAAKGVKVQRAPPKDGVIEYAPFMAALVRHQGKVAPPRDMATGMGVHR